MNYISGSQIVLTDKTMAQAHDVYLSLGSNLGNRIDFLRFALAELERNLTIISVSSVYETEPWGYDDSLPYLNMAVWAKTDLCAFKLRKMTAGIEKAAGRDEKIKHDVHDYQARTLDIDILFYDQITIFRKHPRNSSSTTSLT